MSVNVAESAALQNCAYQDSKLLGCTGRLDGVTLTTALSGRVVANFLAEFPRFRLYRHRFLQVNTRFSAFFKIYQII